MDDVAITELEKIDATRVDGVLSPANGIPILLMKAVAPEVAKGSRDCPKCDKSYDADHQGSKCENCGTDLPGAPAAKSLPDWHGDAAALVKKAMVRGKVDESADIDGGHQAIALVGKLIGYEAQELAAGNLGETADIELLSSAASLLRAWVTGESAVQDGNVMPATTLMQSAAADVEKGGPSAGERKQAAADGNALPDGSYPIRNEKELHAAAILARSGHGDVAGAKKLIARRAKELSVPNPLDDDADDGGASKSRIAKDGADVDTVDQTGGLSKAVEEAVAKAVAPIEKLRRELEETLAKVKATPVPGGPVLSRNVQVKTPGGVVNDDLAAKAALYRAKAEVAVAPSDRDGYLALARETEKAAKTSS